MCAASRGSSRSTHAHDRRAPRLQRPQLTIAMVGPPGGQCAGGRGQRGGEGSGKVRDAGGSGRLCVLRKGGHFSAPLCVPWCCRRSEGSLPPDRRPSRRHAPECPPPPRPVVDSRKCARPTLTHIAGTYRRGRGGGEGELGVPDRAWARRSAPDPLLPAHWASPAPSPPPPCQLHPSEVAGKWGGAAGARGGRGATVGTRRSEVLP